MIHTVIVLMLVGAGSFAQADSHRPATPVNLSGAVTGETALINWEPGVGGIEPAGYNVYRNGSYEATVKTNSWTGEVEPDTLYQFAVVAYGGEKGARRYSSTSEALALPEDLVPADLTIPPSTPVNLSGEIVGAEVTLYWDASTDDESVAGYNVYENNAYLTTVSDATYTGPVEPDESYQWYVVAFDIRSNFSDKSDKLRLPDSGPVDTTQPPSTPTELAGAITDGTLNLTWRASTDDQQVAGYNVYVDKRYVATVFENSYRAATDDDRHHYQVVAFDYDDNFTSLSESLVLPALPGSFDPNEPPSAPADLTGSIGVPDADGQALVELEWQASTDNLGVSGYNVYRNNGYLATVNSTTWSGTVDADEIHSFYVVAFDVTPNFSSASSRINLPDEGNQAPGFVDFDDQTIEAGERWSLIIEPFDVDGDVPGLFPGRLPEGMSISDNFDGTRTLRWQPLQPAVGEHIITMTAFDSVDASLTTTRAITLTVVLPEDLSTIPNLAPTIDAIDVYRVRAGDDIVLRVKAVDANGTVPVLEALNPPIGSTFEEHPLDARARLLRFSTTASDIGTMELVFMATDTDDPGLIAETVATLEVVDGSEFERPGERLRELAASRDILFGYADLLEIEEQPDFELYRDIAAQEFNLVTTENAMKWGFINPEPGEYRWGPADRLIEYAASHDMQVHGHPLIWYTILPPWVQQSEPEQRESIMLDFIDDVVSRYHTDVAIWDVVNEAFEDDGSFRQSVWFEAMGESFIDLAFERTRELDPDGILLYNDYDIGFAGPKSDATYALAERLVNAGVPIDGVGFQMHLNADFSDYDQVAANFQRVADLGLSVYVTELDVSLVPGTTELDQADVFANVTALCLQQPACEAVQIWGFTDRYSWRKNDEPLVLDRNYQPKPAYGALQSVMEN